MRDRSVFALKWGKSDWLKLRRTKALGHQLSGRHLYGSIKIAADHGGDAGTLSRLNPGEQLLNLLQTQSVLAA